jgi:hypothetical protein
MSEQEQAVATEQQPAAPVQPELTIVDLQNLRSIIDVAAKRGAFGAAEMAAVGGAFNKLDAFLQAAAPAQQPEAPAEQPAETPAEQPAV